MPSDLSSVEPDDQINPLTVNPLTQEIRLATTMTGGVSLAIWMGGVARELDLLMQASRWRRAGRRPDVPGDARGEQIAQYRKLIDFLDVLVDVDVQSGTSAGGINSVLLSYCRANGKDMGPLRETWLQLGAMEDLLRKPTDRTIPSLMYGDDKMYAGLITALGNLLDSEAGLPQPAPGGFRDHPERPDTGPSSTLFVTTTLLDGEPNRFTDALGTAVEDTDHHGVFTFTQSDLTDPAALPALALAGRSTASFPGAFEPSYLPAASASPEVGDVAARPAVGALLGTSRAHWAADGGLLDNQPIDLVLQRVFDTRAVRSVRRVLLYVVPSTGVVPSSGGAPGTAPPPPDPSRADTPGAPLGLIDSLLADFSAAMSQTITGDLRAITEHNAQVGTRASVRLQLLEVASRLDGQRLLGDAALAAFVDRVTSTLTVKLTDGFIRAVAADPPEVWAAAFATGGDAQTTFSNAVAAQLNGMWPVTPLPSGPDEFALYGQPALDAAKALALDVVRLAYAAGDDAYRATLMPELETIHDAGRAASRLTEPGRRALLGAAYRPSGDGSITTAAAAVVALYEGRRVDAASWDALGDAVARILRTAPAGGQALEQYRHYFTGERGAVGQLFDLAVSERALQPPAISPDQAVELIQVSADTRSLLSRRDSAAAKLTGMQFHHFGAFYKRSWRANDWMWGRLDGCGWLVAMVLDPRRLAEIARRARPTPAGRAQYVYDRLVDIVGSSPSVDTGVTLGGKDAVEKELTFLDVDPPVPPASLPNTALWVAGAWQAIVARDEIPQLADEILEPGADWSPRTSLQWAREVGAGKDTTTALRTCPVPGETFATDRGSPLMARTLSKAVATATGALATADRVPAGLRSALGTVRTIAVAGYRIESGVRGVARRAILGGLLLVLVGVLLATQSSTILGFGGLGLAVLGAYLLVIAVWQASGTLFPALLGVLVTAAIGSLAITAERHFLFGSSAADGGWVGRHVHWLGDEWWHPLVVVLGLLVVLALESVAVAAARGRASVPAGG